MLPTCSDDPLQERSLYTPIDMQVSSSSLPLELPSKLKICSQHQHETLWTNSDLTAKFYTDFCTHKLAFLRADH